MSHVGIRLIHFSYSESHKSKIGRKKLHKNKNSLSMYTELLNITTVN